MNANTQTQQTEARAIQAPTLEAADPTKNLILVSLSRLVSRPTGRNVRKTPRMSIPELAASIQRVGLLQNLIVTATTDGERYEVVAGGRRLAALKLLAKRRISKEWDVPACWWPMAPPARPASPRTCSAKPCTPPTSSRHSPRWWPKAAASRTLQRIFPSRRWWCSAA